MGGYLLALSMQTPKTTLVERRRWSWSVVAMSLDEKCLFLQAVWVSCSTRRFAPAPLLVQLRAALEYLQQRKVLSSCLSQELPISRWMDQPQHCLLGQIWMMTTTWLLAQKQGGKNSP